jgi:hypothetical protein
MAVAVVTEEVVPGEVVPTLAPPLVEAASTEGDGA